MDFMNNVLFPALSTILTGLLSLGIAALVKWLKTQVENEKLGRALENVRDIITAAVAQTSQTFVDDLKKNGAFSAERQAEAFRQTAELVKKQLTEEAAGAINEITKDAEAWLAAEIEKAVKAGK